MIGRHPWSFRTPIAILFACAVIADPRPAVSTPVQTCTVLNVRGVPIAGVVCGGSSHALFCSAGALYSCRSGVLGQTNNCTLSRACAVGCLTGATTGTLSDACFFGSPVLTASTTRTLGGNDVGFTVTLAVSHPSGAIVNLGVNRGDFMPGASRAAPGLPP